MSELIYRKLALEGEDVALYFDLYRKVYGSTSSLENRWRWEYEKHPLVDALTIYAVQDGNDLVAATTRLPFDLKVGSQFIRSYFSVDSMALSSYRRQGLMGSLYKQAMAEMPLLYSKGAVPGMYKLLLKLGYQPIVPNTYLVYYMAPIKLLMARIMGDKVCHQSSVSPFRPGADMTFVDRYGEEFDCFWQRTAEHYDGIVVKTSDYLNWRYMDIPYKQYAAYYRMQNGQIVSWVVLGKNGHIGKIADILWDNQIPDEPGTIIRFALRYFKNAGCAKVLCWGTQRKLRRALKRRLFLDRKETPCFSVYSAQLSVNQYVLGHRFHFVDGDGDYDFLG